MVKSMTSYDTNLKGIIHLNNNQKIMNNIYHILILKFPPNAYVEQMDFHAEIMSKMDEVFQLFLYFMKCILKLI
jgi:hypothetical protein